MARPDSDAHEGSLRRPDRRRKTGLLVALGLVVLVVFGAGWGAAMVFESPAQRAASASAPAPGPVTAVVTKGDLSETVSANATVSRRSSQSVTVPAAASPAVVTGHPLAIGKRVGAGSVVLEVDGRPVFAIPGTFPLYRDLTVGDTGPDVRELQSALKAAGFDVRTDGDFGASTGAAVRTLYTRAGYAAKTEVSANAPSGESAPSSGQSVSTNADDQSADGGATKPAAKGTEATTKKVVEVPASELIVFSSLPAYMRSVPNVGTVLGDGDKITVESGAAVADAHVASSVAGSITKGMRCTLTGPDGKKIAAVVADVTMPKKAGDDASVEITPKKGSAVPSGWMHKKALAMITLQKSADDALIVPSSAIVTSGGSHDHVLKQRADGSFREIAVTELGALSGRSAVKVTGSGTLAPGDHVRVG